MFACINFSKKKYCSLKKKNGCFRGNLKVAYGGPGGTQGVKNGSRGANVLPRGYKFVPHFIPYCCLKSNVY